jgi:molecular chaperone GrpE
MNRSDILRRFEAVLDTALTTEDPPTGIPPELIGGADPDDARCDSYALWAATTALTQEVKLQGRAFQDLTRAMEGQAERTAAELRAAFAEKEKLVRAEAERRARKEILAQLLDLRDRLVRGLESARPSLEAAKTPLRRGFWERLLGIGGNTAAPAITAVAALVRGYELALDRLDQSLEEFGVSEIRCQGQMFDARRMNAIETEVSATVPEGTVVEVYRSGFEWEGDIFRTAQVKVAKGQAG